MARRGEAVAKVARVSGNGKTCPLSMTGPKPAAADYYQHSDYLSTDDTADLQLAASGVRTLKTRRRWDGPGV
jgi:hypothetical protein